MSNSINSWNDFNNAEEQNEFDVIPKGTLVKVRMSVRPGGYDDPSQGWTGGYAKQSDSSGAIYLDCEFVVLEGKYAKRKIWSLVGLHSDKGPKWAEMGRAFIKNILNSARGLKKDDNSPQAQQARCISGLQDLDGIEFVAKVGMDKDQYDEPKNIIQIAVTPDNKDYAQVMGSINGINSQSTTQHSAQTTTSSVTHGTQTAALQSDAPKAQQNTNSPSGRPAWAN